MNKPILSDLRVFFERTPYGWFIKVGDGHWRPLSPSESQALEKFFEQIDNTPGPTG
jgi:hypothetical protein